MREILSDIVKHTGSLGFLNTVKITGDDEKTIVESMDEDKTVVLKGELKTTVPDFEGTFGLYNLDLLGQYVAYAPFKADDATIEVSRRKRGEEEFPEKVTFKSGSGTEVVYRFMSQDLLPEQHKLRQDIPWDIDFEPTKQKISEFSQLSNMLSKYEDTFNVAVDDDKKLHILLGDKLGSSHAGSIVFAEDIEGEMNDELYWPVQQTLSILKLGAADGCVSVKFAKIGALMISIVSDHGEWKYILPGRKK